MDSLDFWRLCDEVAVNDAALLIAGVDPAKCFINDSSFHVTHPEFTAVKKALVNAVRSGRLKATIRHDARPRGWDEEPEQGEHIDINDGTQYIFKPEPDWDSTTILVEHLKEWLTQKGFNQGFFFPQIESNTPDYLDRAHSNYSPKLAAAIEAWMSVTQNPDLVKAKSVKQAIVVWLRSHAGRFGLIKEDGNPNESGIEEVAKVANWETKGGAPKTPEV